MIEKQITIDNINDVQIKKLYETAFPVEEQIPWTELIKLIEPMKLDFTAYYTNNQFIGFTVVYPRKSFNWFWYFAVCEDNRGKGLGTQILSRIKEKYNSNSTILDIESPTQICSNTEQRIRRYNFYLRNSFHDTGVGRSFDGIDYTILLHGNTHFTISNYDEIIDELRYFWNKMPQPNK